MDSVMAKNKDLQKLIDQARTWAGWRVSETKKGWFIYPPDKSLPPVAVHNTPSDHRALANTVARLRRYGAPV
jgi:hypothetical protein